MRFHITSIMALVATAFAAVTPQEAIQNIRSITAISQALQAPAQSITLVNGPLIIVGQGPFPKIIAGFADIITTTTSAIAAMQGTPQFSSADSSAVVNAFREFVRVHQVLLNILIGKSGLFSTVPFVGQPVAAVLRQLENVVDTVAFALIDMLDPSSKNQATMDSNSLAATIDTAIAKYSGIQDAPVVGPLGRRALAYKA